MRRLSVAVRWLGILACATLIAVSTTTAQTSPMAPSAGRWRVPRTRDGRPDLQGLWTNMTATPLQRPRELGAFRGATSRLHVVERFTRTGPTTVTYRATVDDPDTWPVPWTLEFPFEASTQRTFEYACHEGNYAAEGVLRGARADERAGRKR